MLNPTLDVDVAKPEIERPDRVVVPKPREDTESCVAVDEPTTNPTESPASGLTDSRANGVVDEIPILPVVADIDSLGVEPLLKLNVPAAGISMLNTPPLAL